MAGLLSRTLKHLSTGTGAVHRRFNADAMTRIRNAIAAAELGHGGEIRFAVEAALPLRAHWQRKDAHARALELFAQLRVWDTAANTGVLLYLLWADHAIEIVVDRGIAALLPASAWESVCADVREALRSGQPADAVCLGVTRIGALLRDVLPAQAHTPDELADNPVML
jgi:uncharacterized membrane protein